MLDSLRSNLRGPIAWVFIAVVGGALSLFFVPELVRGLNQRGAATVGPRTIGEFELSLEFQNRVDQIARDAGGAFTAEDARGMNLQAQVLGDLIRRELIDLKATELGFGASDELVLAQIEDMPVFHDPATGAFSTRQYALVLNNARLTNKQFEQDLEDEIRARPLIDAIAVGLTPPKLLAEPLLRYASESRTLTVATIGPDAGSPSHTPTEEELREFHKQRQPDYETPERRDFVLVKLEVADLFDAVELTDEDVRMEFDVRRESLEQPERRTLVELSAPDLVTAEVIAERLRAGEEAAAVADDLELPEPNRYDDVVQSEIFDPAAAEAAFALEEGAVSDPIEGAITWGVWRAVSVTAGVSTTFEEAEGELRAELAGILANDILIDRLATFEDALASGASLEVAAGEADIEPVTYTGIDRDGFDADGARVVALGQSPQILQRAFSVSSGFATDIDELGREGFFALRVDAVAPPQLLTYEEVVDDVAFAWEQRAIERSLDELVETARDALSDGPSDASALPAGAVLETVTAARNMPAPDQLPQSVLAQAFSYKIGDVAVGATADGGRVAARVDEIIPAETVDEMMLDISRMQLGSEIAGDVNTLALQALQHEYAVRINDDIAARAVGDVSE